MFYYALAKYILWHARESKKPIFWKIRNKYFYSPYSNETFYMKALEYKENFTPIDVWEFWRVYVGILNKFFLDMKSVSKYTIV